MAPQSSAPWESIWLVWVEICGPNVTTESVEDRGF